MFDGFLLIVFSIFVLITGIKILKQNILFGGTYFFLYIYSIFAQIAYAFFPELSELSHAYYGKEYFYNFYVFTFLSFITFFLLFQIRFPKLKRKEKYNVVKKVRPVNYLIFIFFILLFLTYQLFYFYTNYDFISYDQSNPQVIAEGGTMFFIFSVCFKFMAAIILILYAQYRLKKDYVGISYLKRYHVFFLLLIFLPLFYLIANKLGNRTDILALLLGILTFEYLMGFNKKKLLKMGLAVLAVMALLFYIQNTRGNQENHANIAYVILLNDYFAPAQMLYAAMGENYIKPIVVLVSNISNTLVKLNYPYLQQPITDIINPGIANRSQGYAFYLFTEGFMFMGYFGFIYNAFMLFFGLSIWYRIQNSANKYYSILIISIMCTQLANIARSQSSYFYKDIYMLFLPVLVLIYLSSGLRPRFVK